MPHGDKRVIARQLGVAPLTLSRWLSGVQPPSPRHLARLKQVFDLSDGLPLDREPLTEAMLARYRASARILHLNDAHLAVVLRLLAELEPRESAAVTDH